MNESRPRLKDSIGTPDLSLALQAALLAGNGRTHQGFATELGPLRRTAPILDCIGLDSLSAMVTIALSVSRTGNISAGETNDTPPVVAVVDFGVEGHRMSLECDFVNGTLLSIPASSLRVSARIDLPSDEDDFNVVLAGAILGYFPHGGRGAQRTITSELTAVAGNPANIATFPIPAFARDVSFLLAPSAAFTVQQLSDAAGTVVLAAETVAAPPVRVMSIANRARYLRVTNPAAAPATISAIFGLSV